MSDPDLTQLAVLLDPNKAAADLDLASYAKLLPDGRVEFTFQFPIKQKEDDGEGARPVEYTTIVIERPKGRHVKMLAKATAGNDVDTIEDIIVECSDLVKSTIENEVDGLDYNRLMAAFSLFMQTAPRAQKISR